MMRSSRTILLLAAAAGLITLLVYLPALTCGFVNLDDPYFVEKNPFIRKLNRDLVVWAFTAPNFDLWIPLTWLSLAVDFHFWGLNPLGYHLTNIILHAISVAILVLIFDQFFGERFVGVPRGSLTVRRYYGILLAGGLFFGLHPLRVESVVWVSERKDVLNGVFSLGSLFFYLLYTNIKESPDAGAGKARIYYWTSFVALLISLTAKSISVVLPLLFLLADWYPLGRFVKGRRMRILWEKLPFLMLSVMIALATIYFAASHQLLASYSSMPLVPRLLVSGNAVFEYVRLLLLPIGILPYYSLPAKIPAGYFLKTGIIIFCVFSLLFVGKKRPWLAASVCSFLLPLLPVLALLQNGAQSHAARYTYLPSALISIAMVAMLGYVFQKKEMACRGALLLVAGLLTVYVCVTLRLIRVWENTGTFWTRVIEISPIDKAYSDRGVFYLINGKSSAAVDDLSAAIAIARRETLPNIYNLYAFRGVALSDIGRHEEAVGDFNEAITRFPHQTYFHYRGLSLKALGRMKESREDLERGGPNPPPIDWF